MRGCSADQLRKQGSTTELKPGECDEMAMRESEEEE